MQGKRLTGSTSRWWPLGGAFLPLLVTLALVGGCASETHPVADGGAPAEDEPAPGAETADAAVAPHAGGNASCLLPDSLGALGMVPGFVIMYDPVRIIGWDGRLALNDRLNLLSLELFTGYGAFASGFAPGTYTLAGEELNYATCGLCVLLRADVDPQAGSVRQRWLATGGTVTFTSVTGRLTGRLENVTFTDVTINPTTHESTPLDTCPVEITSASFDAVPPSGGG